MDKKAKECYCGYCFISKIFAFYISLLKIEMFIVLDKFALSIPKFAPDCLKSIELVICVSYSKQLVFKNAMKRNERGIGGSNTSKQV